MKLLRKKWNQFNSSPEFQRKELPGENEVDFYDYKMRIYTSEEKSVDEMKSCQAVTEYLDIADYTTETANELITIRSKDLPSWPLKTPLKPFYGLPYEHDIDHGWANIFEQYHKPGVNWKIKKFAENQENPSNFKWLMFGHCDRHYEWYGNPDFDGKREDFEKKEHKKKNGS